MPDQGFLCGSHHPCGQMHWALAVDGKRDSVGLTCVKDVVAIADGEEAEVIPPYELEQKPGGKEEVWGIGGGREEEKEEEEEEEVHNETGSK